MTDGFFPDISIDNETLATSPDAFLLATALVPFDRATGQIGSPLYMVFDGNQPGRRIDPGTVRWWMTQDLQPRQAVFANNDAWPVDLALGQIAAFVESHKPQRIWGNGSNFDVAQLEHLFIDAGRDVPWHYRAPRDMRTIVDLASTSAGVQITEVVDFEGDAHNALDDAVYQAKVISRAYGYLIDIEDFEPPTVNGEVI
jgi:hypothetical protein